MSSSQWLLRAILLGQLLYGREVYAEATKTVLVPRQQGADDEQRRPRATNWDLFGNARLRFVGLRDFPVDSLGTTAQRSFWGESRLIVGARYEFTPRLSAVVEIDALNGQFMGDYTTLGLVRGEDTFRFARHEAFGGAIVLPRKAYAQLETSFGRLVIGQQSFNWGLGLIANDGAGDPDFGDPYQGSLVERIALFTQPWRHRPDAPNLLRNMTIFGALDIPFQDDNASLLAGDFALAWVAGMRTKTPTIDFGFFVSQRKQWDRTDPGHPETPGLHVGIVDCYGQFFLTNPAASQSLRFESEMVFIGGHTTRPYLETTAENGAIVTTFGGAWRLRYDDDEAHTTTKLEIGHASGDNDPQDARFRQFTFNSDYNVGLILFDQYLPMVSARAVDRLTNRGLTGVIPAGTRHLVNQGTVTNAVYFHPTIRWRPIPPLDVRAGWLIARANADVIDPYNTAKNGGFNTSYGNRPPTSRMLGQEMDVSVRYQIDLGKQIKLRIGTEGGLFFPENAFDGISDKNVIWIARGMTDVRF